MSYLDEILAIRDWKQVTAPTTGEIALLYALYDVNNMAGWVEWFTAPNTMVYSLTNLNEDKIKYYRNRLIQKERIFYQKGTGNKAGKYKINFFYGEISYCGEKRGVILPTVSRQSTDTFPTVSPTVSRQSTPLIDKIRLDVDETRKDNIIIDSAGAPEFDNIFQAVVQHYKDHIGETSDGISNGLADFLRGGMEADLIMYLINYASVEARSKNWNYLKKVLRSTFDQGFKTLPDYEEKEAARKAAKQNFPTVSPQFTRKQSTLDMINEMIEGGQLND